MNDFYQWLMIVCAILFLPVYAVVRDRYRRKVSIVDRIEQDQKRLIAEKVDLGQVTLRMPSYRTSSAEKGRSAQRIWQYRPANLAKPQSSSVSANSEYAEEPFFPAYYFQDFEQGLKKTGTDLPN